MTPRTYPAHPEFADDSERLVWDSLKAGLRDTDVLMHGIRLTDREFGEVEIDLLVLMPDSGAVVIEVKGGHVTYADGTWRQSGAEVAKTIDPVRQARNGVYSLCRFLEHEPTWSRGDVRAAWMIALPYADVDGSMGPEARRDLIIGRSDLATAATMAYDRLWDPALQTRIPAEGWIESALELLLGALDGAADIAGRSAARLRHVDQLTADQRSILKIIRLNPRIEVAGAAGTGKTWLAIEQARLWAEAGERVCFVSYGRGVVEMVRKAMSDLPPSSQPTFLGTFHQLGYGWGAKPADDDGSEFWETLAPQQMSAAAAGLPASERYSAFVVDEAQDFADSWWPALLASASTVDFRLAVFRDDEQTVFSQRRGRPDLPMVPLVLDENLRNAQQIVDTFRPLITSRVLAKGGDGFPVEYVDCETADVIGSADDVVEALVQHRGWLPEQVALLTTQHRHPVHVERSADKDDYWHDLWSVDDIFYSTVAGFKGLERPVVVLAVDGFHEGITPQSVLYSGMSRARDLLIVVGPSAVLEPLLGVKGMRRLRRTPPESLVPRAH